MTWCLMPSYISTNIMAIIFINFKYAMIYTYTFNTQIRTLKHILRQQHLWVTVLIIYLIFDWNKHINPIFVDVFCVCVCVCVCLYIK
jgi:hypothetical protein